MKEPLQSQYTYKAKREQNKLDCSCASDVLMKLFYMYYRSPGLQQQHTSVLVSHYFCSMPAASESVLGGKEYKGKRQSRGRTAEWVKQQKRDFQRCTLIHLPHVMFICSEGALIFCIFSFSFPFCLAYLCTTWAFSIFPVTCFAWSHPVLQYRSSWVVGQQRSLSSAALSIAMELPHFSFTITQKAFLLS